MSVLFSKRKKTKRKVVEPEEEVEKPCITDTESPKALPATLQTFQGLGLSAWLSNKCDSIGIRRPTPVQSNCIPEILKGRDAVGCSPTGSGKTAAYALPILHKLEKDPYGPFAVILIPTRELACQIHDQFLAFGSAMGVKSCLIVGGEDLITQSIALEQRPHVIVATPGRLRHHLLYATPPDLSKISFLVFDEADRLLEDSFAADLKCILEKSNKAKRQTLVFSATMTPGLHQLEELILSDAYRFDATPTVSTVETLDQKYVFLPSHAKVCYLVHLLKEYGPSPKQDDEEESETRICQEGRSVIIFAATCKMCQVLTETLKELGFNCVALHSILSQNSRRASLGKFKSGLSRILICTDVASRGLDIPSVELVINFDIPRQATDYIHRVGRTARAGKSGFALSFVSENDIALFQNIEKEIGREMEGLDVREASALSLLNEVSDATRNAKMKLADSKFNDKLKHRREQRRKKYLVKNPNN